MTNDDHPAAPRPVDTLADQFVTDYCALAPYDATFIGVPGHDHETTDFTPDGFTAREELLRRVLLAVENATPADPREVVAQTAMIERLRLDVQRLEAQIPQTHLNVVESPMHDMRMVFDLMDTDGQHAWENIASRLEKLPEALHGYQATLRQGIQAGNVTARRQVESCAKQIDAWTDPNDGGDFFGRLVSGWQGDADDSLQARLDKGAAVARQAYTDFARFLRDELAAHARYHDAVGEDAYSLGSRFFLGTAVDLEETYAWGWDELKRIEDEMAAVVDRIEPGGSLADAVRALDADPQRNIEGKEAFRAWMQQRADETIANLGGTHFDIPEPIQRIECCIAPTEDGAIYYTPPSEDFSRPGRMWWSVPAGTTRFSTWREVTTVYHEGVPGHHLQVAQAAYRSDLLNRWQRLMCFVSGHGEGWALYAERLMDDLGYLEDPGEKLGMLDGQAFRAVRVIVDIGMHLELEIPRDNPFGFHPGERWTPELGFEFMTQHSRIDKAFLRHELDRYLGIPGQAPAYKVGERIWLRARDDVRARKGSDFDLRRFHQAALDLGPLGLDPLQSALARL